MEFFRRAKKKGSTMTTMQILGYCVKSTLRGVKSTFRLIYTVLTIAWLFLMYSTGLGGKKEGEEDDEDVLHALPVSGMGHPVADGAARRSTTPHPEKQQFYMFAPDLHPVPEPNMEAFGIQITTEEAPENGTRKVHLTVNKSVDHGTGAGPLLTGSGAAGRGESLDDEQFAMLDMPSSAAVADSSRHQQQGRSAQAQQPSPTTTTSVDRLAPPLLSPTFTGKSLFESGSVISGPAGPPISPDESVADVDVYEPKIAETVTKSKSNFFSIFARSYFTLKYITLFLAFLINVILLFYRVNIYELEGKSDVAAANGSGGDDEVAAVNNSTLIVGLLINETAAAAAGEPAGEEAEPREEILISENFYYLNHILFVISLAHCLVALALLIAYYQLKVPLVVFKREKEVARKLEFEGMWITEQPSEDAVKYKWDSLVISAQSFPLNYWDKFVKKKVKDKFREQFDEAELDRLLGLDTASGQGIGSSKHGPNQFDWRYQTWKLGVIISDGSFLYQLAYFGFSVMGNFNPFFYAGHLIDMVISFPMLQTILKSVTHNGKQLSLTVMMVLVVVYLYTVLAFNFFRKFYVQEEEGEIDRKCHNMITCFIFNLYAGVRAGGGIGDELESPYGDEREGWRILFDMTFHVFVIIILLAIMQGLIIDAFGELRDQQDTAQEKLESNCFICDLSKDFFDKLPRGFEQHTDKEHNLANYLFFLMHLINKDETEYTGQETYVYRLYEERCWDFFPVGECFLKQYEDQLMVT